MSEGKVSQGTLIVHVRNLDLAVCLQSVGIPLFKDPPYTHKKLANGQHEIVFNFESTNKDGDLDTMQLVHAFKEDSKFIAENPEHPFTFAMVAVKNIHAFKEHFLRDIPYVGFQQKGGRATLWVKEGSKKHQRQIQKGATQV